MAKTKISELPVYTGDTTGVFLVMDSPDLSTTYRVKKENLNKITGSNKSVAYFSGSNSITGANNMYVLNDGDTISIGSDVRNSTYPERLYVENEHFNIATFSSTLADGYAEVNILNTSTGSNSSTDLILWNDQTTESSSFFDIGINSSNYSAGGVGYQNDAYIINATNDLYIGSLINGNQGHVHIYGGISWQSSSISVYQDGTIGFGTDWLDNSTHTIPTSGFQYEFSGSVKLDNSLSVVSDITGSIISATNNGNGTNFKVGDDAWIGDVNRTNTIQISGQQDSTKGYIKFGSGSASPSFGYGGSNDHVDLSCALKLQQFPTLPTATVGTLAVSGSHLYFHNGTSWQQVI
jgi:hypothetical protein